MLAETHNVDVEYAEGSFLEGIAMQHTLNMSKTVDSTLSTKLHLPQSYSMRVCSVFHMLGLTAMKAELRNVNLAIACSLVFKGLD